MRASAVSASLPGAMARMSVEPQSQVIVGVIGFRFAIVAAVIRRGLVVVFAVAVAFGSALRAFV